MLFEERTKKRQPIFKGHVIEVVLDEVTLPNGATANRELVLHQGSVGIIAVTKEDKLVIVRQFRKPLEQVTLEIPAGKIDAGETNYLATAQRELEEETDYRARHWQELIRMYLAPGFTNEQMVIYVATDLEKVTDALPLDEDEFVEIVEFAYDEAQAAVIAGEICDAKTLYALQWWVLQRNKGGE